MANLLTLFDRILKLSPFCRRNSGRWPVHHRSGNAGGFDYLRHQRPWGKQKVLDTADVKQRLKS